MIVETKEIGSYNLKSAAKDSLQFHIEKIKEKNYKYAFVVDINGDNCDMYLEENDELNSDKYLYKKGSSVGTNYSPTSMITREGTFDFKFIAWFKKYTNSLMLIEKEKEELLQIKNILDNNYENLVSKLKENLSDKKNSGFLTLKIEGKYLKEIPIFTNIFTKLLNSKVGEMNEGNIQCSICGEMKSNIIEIQNVYAFYTIDKPGFIIGGFEDKRSKFNYPVCSDCYNLINKGKKIVSEKLSFKFYGLNYLLFPKLLIGKTSDYKDILDIYFDQTKQIKLKENIGKEYIGNEDEILYIIKDNPNYITNTFMFIERQQAAERILLQIDDVLPSRLRKIFEVKTIVENAFSTDEYKTIFTFIKIRQFFSKSDDGKKGNDLDEYFLTIIDSVFKEKNLELDFLLKFFMKKIRNAFLNNFSNKYYLIKDAIMNLMFLYNLQILPINEGVKMEDPIFNDFFEKYSMQLNSPEKRGLLLLGALVENLLYIQRTDRGAEPFWHHLKSLKMNETEFKGLIPKATEKLHQYDKLKTWDKKLISVINDYFLKSTVKWNMSIDEMNFYFSCGMSMQYEIYSKFNNSNNKENQNGKN